MLRFCLDQMLNDRQAKAADVERSFTVTQSFKNQSSHRQGWDGMQRERHPVARLSRRAADPAVLFQEAPTQILQVTRPVWQAEVLAMCSPTLKTEQMDLWNVYFPHYFLLCLRWSSNWGQERGCSGICWDQVSVNLISISLPPTNHLCTAKSSSKKEGWFQARFIFTYLLC